jgi:hypothetical protein
MKMHFTISIVMIIMWPLSKMRGCAADDYRRRLFCIIYSVLCFWSGPFEGLHFAKDDNDTINLSNATENDPIITYCVLKERRECYLMHISASGSFLLAGPYF